MKLATAKSFFKKVSESAAIRAGEKRADITWQHQLIEAADIPSLPADQVAKVVTSFVEAFGRKLIAQNGADWNYIPQPEQVTFESAYADFTAERTSTKVLTKESLAAFGAFYKEKAASVLGVAAAAAVMGEKIICAKLANIAGKDDVLEVFSRRLETLVEAVSEDEILPHAEVVEKLLILAAELKSVSVDASML